MTVTEEVEKYKKKLEEALSGIEGMEVWSGANFWFNFHIRIKKDSRYYRDGIDTLSMHEGFLGIAEETGLIVKHIQEKEGHDFVRVWMIPAEKAGLDEYFRSEKNQRELEEFA